jgi:hypothetical protein
MKRAITNMTTQNKGLKAKSTSLDTLKIRPNVATMPPKNTVAFDAQNASRPKDINRLLI